MEIKKESLIYLDGSCDVDIDDLRIQLTDEELDKLLEEDDRLLKEEIEEYNKKHTEKHIEKNEYSDFEW